MIIVIGHHKGGTGKSTVAVNLAVELQRRGDSVLLLDADPTIRTTTLFAADREEAELPPITAIQKNGNLHQALADFSTRYDHVIVDVPGKDSREMRTALTAADVLLSPTRATQADLDAVEGLMTTVMEARDFNPNLKVLVVINFAATHSFARDRQDAQGYLAGFPEATLARTMLHQRKIYAELSGGRGVVELGDPKAKAEIQLLTQEVLQCL